MLHVHKKVCKNYEINNLDGYHVLHVQSDTLSLADAFLNVYNMCLEIYELDHVHFYSAPGLERKTALKKTKVKLDLLTIIDMLLMVKKVLEVEYAIH